MSDERATVERWLARSGFPLEFETARAFRAAGFRAYQGLHYRDSGTSKQREVDVLAVREQMTSTPRPVRVTCLWIVECKTISAPWVVLRSDRPGGKWEGLDGVPSHPLKAEHVLGALEETSDPWLIRMPAGAGYRAVQAESRSGADPAFEAFAQVVSASQSLVHGERSLIPTVGVPMVVVSGSLFALQYTAEGTPQLAETTWERLEWTAHPSGVPTVVDLVSRAGLAEYLALASAAADEYLPLMRAAWLAARREILEAEHDRREAAAERPNVIMRMLGRR